MSDKLEYRVLHHDGEWKVLLDKYYGPWPTQDAAVSNAVDAAKRMQRQYVEVSVVLMDDAGNKTELSL
ncbi:MAG TPA: hypothetical protein VHM26_14775 [Chitinophagaceae bacterium]|jgi:hypothetical protein|nr:hypothetical protein [Chitinophagaceae bacterium]